MNTKEILRKILCWPLFLGALLVLVIHALWGQSLRWEKGVLITVLSEKSWPMRSWYKPWGGTAFGYGIMLSPLANDKTLNHEFVHTEQDEGGTVGGLILGLAVLAIVHSWWGVPALLACWIGSGRLVYLGASIVSWLHGKEAYRGNNLEEAARNHPGSN